MERAREMRSRVSCGRERAPAGGEDGFLLMGALVAIFLVLLVLGLAAPTMARELRRDRELEAVHRGNQYVRAVQLYYKKFGHYPSSMDQLEKSNNIRFLRQKYVDPMTGKADWRLIHVGEQKTTLKGFFGQPLAGLATSNIGGGIGGTSTVAGSSGAGGSPLGGGLGSSSGSGLGSSLGSSLGSGSATGGGLGSGGGLTAGGGSATPASGSTVDSSGGSGSSGISSQSATSFKGGGAPIVGFGSSATGESIIVLNEQTTHPTWEFIYDPRIEQMKAKSNLLGGGVSSTTPSGVGSLSPSSSPGTTPAGTGTTPAGGAPSGTTPSGTTP